VFQARIAEEAAHILKERVMTQKEKSVNANKENVEIDSDKPSLTKNTRRNVSLYGNFIKWKRMDVLLEDVSLWMMIWMN
jgi:hypothetical protein